MTDRRYRRRRNIQRLVREQMSAPVTFVLVRRWQNWNYNGGRKRVSRGPGLRGSKYA